MQKITVFMIALAAGSTPALAKIQGLYGSDCLKVEGLSAYKDLAFDDGQLRQVQTVFLDSECLTTAYDFTFAGPYSLDETTEFLNYSFTSIRLTALDSKVAENFNSHQLCGISDWVVGEAQDVAGLDCGGQQIPNIDVEVFDRIQQNNTTIRMSRASDEFDGSSSDRRPQELAEFVFHAR